MMDGSTRPAIDRLIQHIQSRPGTIKVLIGGSVFSNDQHGQHGYGKASYDDERNYFFQRLRDEIKNNTIKGLVFLSGDIHGHEVNQVKLPEDPSPSTDYRLAIEIVSSPLARNDNGKNLTDLPITGERKARIETTPTSGNWGYARITINTSLLQLTVEYVNESTGNIIPMDLGSGQTINSKTITLNSNNEFVWS
jgi:phosphodiesterase/alkaline phosphatase D-like protein